MSCGASSSKRLCRLSTSGGTAALYRAGAVVQPRLRRTPSREPLPDERWPSCDARFSCCGQRRPRRRHSIGRSFPLVFFPGRRAHELAALIRTVSPWACPVSGQGPPFFVRLITLLSDGDQATCKGLQSTPVSSHPQVAATYNSNGPPLYLPCPPPPVRSLGLCSRLPFLRYCDQQGQSHSLLCLFSFLFLTFFSHCFFFLSLGKATILAQAASTYLGRHFSPYWITDRFSPQFCLFVIR